MTTNKHCMKKPTPKYMADRIRKKGQKEIKEAPDLNEKVHFNSAIPVS